MHSRKADTQYIGKSKQEKKWTPNVYEQFQNRAGFLNMSHRRHLNLCAVASAQLKYSSVFINNYKGILRLWNTIMLPKARFQVV